MLYKWKCYLCATFRDDLLSHAVLLKEANAISVELRKKVEFQFTLLTDTLYTPLPSFLLSDVRHKDNPTVLAVEVKDMKNGASHYWSLGKLRDRLEDMRFMYDTAAESNTKISFDAVDPFYDALPWFRLIGRAFIYLSNLVYGVVLEQSVPIVSESGDIQGNLSISIQQCTDNQTWHVDDMGRSSVLWLDFRSDVSEQKREVEEEEAEEAAEADEVTEPPFSKGTLHVGKPYVISITVLQAQGIPAQYTDIFCQIRFLCSEEDEGFCTEPVANNHNSSALGFYFTQKVGVVATRDFIDYISTRPLQVEVFGHYHPQQHQSSIQLPRAIVKEGKTDSKSSRDSTPSVSVPYQLCDDEGTLKFDLLVWVEVYEMSPSGDYFPCVVRRKPDIPCGGVFLLHQGIQRRLVVTIIHENSMDIRIRRVMDLVVGRVRTTLVPPPAGESSPHTVSLSVLSPQVQSHPDENKCVFRFEASWDSSLHNSILLNRVTPPGELVFVTMSAYLELENCCQTSCISKDISVCVFGRDSKTSSRSVWSLFGSSKRPENDKLSDIFELVYHPADEHGQLMKTKRRVVMDTSGIYVRGEENLGEWKPRGLSLIDEHQAHLDKLERIQEVGKARHILCLGEKLMSSDRPDTVLIDPGIFSAGSECSSRSSLGSISLSSSFLSIASIPAGKPLRFTRDVDPVKVKETLLKKCLRLLTWKNDLSEVKTLSPASSSQGGATALGTQRNEEDEESRVEYYVPEVVLVRKNPVISKRGYLHIMDDCSSRWSKCYVIVRKPYVLLYRQEGDPVEQFLINLKHSKVECPEYFVTFSVFSIRTRHCRFLVRTTTEKEEDTFDWLYALDPLLAGSIRSRRGSLKQGRK